MDSDTFTKMFFEKNKDFITLVGQIPFSKNLTKIKSQIKKYNLEFNLHINQDEDFPDISKVSIKQIDETGMFFYYHNLKSVQEDFILNDFTYLSKYLFIGKKLCKYTHVFNDQSKILSQINVQINFQSNQIPVILTVKMFDKTEQDKSIADISKININYINILNKHISTYNIDVYKLMIDDKKYIQSLDETLDHILLEDDDTTLRKLIYETNFCGCFSTEKLIIEKKPYNMTNLYKREQKVSKRFHFMFGSKILKAAFIFLAISICLYLTSFLFIK